MGWVDAWGMVLILGVWDDVDWARGKGKGERGQVGIV